MGSAFARLKSRYLLLWLVLSGLFGALVASPPTLPASSPEPLQLGVLAWVMYAALMLLTGLQAWWAGLHPGHILGARVSGTSLARMSVLAIPLVGVAMACTYGVFAPLSLIWPGAVHFLLIQIADKRRQVIESSDNLIRVATFMNSDSYFAWDPAARRYTEVLHCWTD